MQVRGFGLALERAQPRSRLAFDVERPVEVVLGVAQLQLRAPPALAVLAQAGGLFDQQAPVARLGGDDRFDASLRDHRVHLLAQAGVGQQLDHVDQPAARAGEPVLALARAVQAPHDRHLGRSEPEHALAVIEHELDLGRLAGLSSGCAAEDHVLHRLAAHGDRRLLAERPQDSVGDVGLARSVRADDHAHAGPELEAGAVGERLEALQRDRLQIHGRVPPHSSASSAAWAASCSASFLLRPEPRPTSAPSIVALTENTRSCGGPCSSTTS